MSDKKTKKGPRILKRHPHLKMRWHPQSKLVFNDETKVVGMYEDEHYEDLNNEAINRCVEWQFPYDESLVQMATESDSEQEVGKEEVEEVEEEHEAEEQEPEEEHEAEEQEPEEEPEEEHEAEEQEHEVEEQEDKECDTEKCEKVCVLSDKKDDFLQVFDVFEKLSHTVQCEVDRAKKDISEFCKSSVKEASAYETRLEQLKAERDMWKKEYESAKSSLDAIRKQLCM